MDAERLHSNIWFQLQDWKSSSATLNNQSDPSGPLILTGDSATSDASMFQTLAISDSCSPELTGHPLQTFHQMRHFTKSVCTTTGLTSTPCQDILLVGTIFPAPNCVPQTLQTSQATSDSQEALEFHLHGFHNEAPLHLPAITLILVIVDHILKQSLFDYHQCLNNLHNPSFAMSSPSMVSPSHVTSDHGMEFVPHFFHSLGTALDMKLSFHLWISSQRWQTNQPMNQTLNSTSESTATTNKTIGPNSSISWVHLQQYSEATISITPSFPTGFYHLNLTIHPSMTSHPHVLITLSQTSTNYTGTLATHCQSQHQFSSCWFPAKLCPRIQIEPNVCKAQFFHMGLTSKNSLIIPWTIWSPCTSWHPFNHPVTSEQSPHCTPGFPHLYVGTSMPKPDSKWSSTSTLCPSCWWQTVRS